MGQAVNVWQTVLDSPPLVRSIWLIKELCYYPILMKKFFRGVPVNIRSKTGVGDEIYYPFPRIAVSKRERKCLALEFGLHLPLLKLYNTLDSLTCR